MPTNSTLSRFTVFSASSYDTKFQVPSCTSTEVWLGALDVTLASFSYALSSLGSSALTSSGSSMESVPDSKR